jgi:hypothetical protein
MSWADDLECAVGVNLDDTARFVRAVIVSAETADIVCTIEDSLFYLMEEVRCRMTTDIGGRRNDRMP